MSRDQSPRPPPIEYPSRDETIENIDGETPSPAGTDSSSDTIQPFLRPFPHVLYKQFCRLLHSVHDNKTLLSFQRISRHGYKAATPFIYRNMNIRDDRDYFSLFDSCGGSVSYSEYAIYILSLFMNDVEAVRRGVSGISRLFAALRHCSAATVALPSEKVYGTLLVVLYVLQDIQERSTVDLEIPSFDIERLSIAWHSDLNLNDGSISSMMVLAQRHIPVFLIRMYHLQPLPGL